MEGQVNIRILYVRAMDKSNFCMPDGGMERIKTFAILHVRR